MSYAIAVPALAGVLFLMNLVLALAVLRRLRRHTARIDHLYEVVAGAPDLDGPAAGDLVGDFSATDLDAAPVTRDSLPEGGVVAFLSPDCEGCRAELAELTAWAAGQDRSRVLAVVDARAGDPARMVAALSAVARVVVERDHAHVAEAFGARTVPTVFRVAAGGTVLSRVRSVTRLPETAGSRGAERAASNPS
ncbi:hypothetical protein [Nonomuraea sp. NPDC049758]|uniref:TlpA family protein disulfide reductase n=1 Tax=Nonomuraea sp. NPDC049758 TaxID=3154360 RepID=UPI0034267A0C